nr:zinc finger, CCHC-type [Tanacetum cinerariifolium]
GAHEDRGTKVFQVSNDDTTVAQRRLEDKKPAVKETNVTLLAKVCCFLIQSVLSKVLWAEDTTRNMGFNESGEYKKTFIGSGVGMGSMYVLYGFEFEVKPREYHTFEVEPRRMPIKEHVYKKEDNNEAAFAVAVVEKIYAHESLTFNNKVACEVIFKWKAGLKDGMDARSDVYVLNNGCRKCSDDSDGYYQGRLVEIKAVNPRLAPRRRLADFCNTGYYSEYTLEKENVLCIKIVRDQNGNTLRVSQFRFYNEKLVQTLLEGHSILSLEGSLLGDCDMKKNLQVFMDFDYAMERSITVMESRYELSLVACIATGALVKAGSRFEVSTQSRLLRIGID